MPIYEFECEDCKAVFERLMMAGDDPVGIKCPQCNGQNINKLMSAGFVRAHGIPTGSGGFKAPTCAPAGGG